MTKEKKIPKINLPKEKIQKVAQKTVQSIAPAVGGWWQFMKIKVGPVWSVIIILLVF